MPNPKAEGANASANIDVWVIGGDIKLLHRGTFHDTRVAGRQVLGKGVGKVIIDGSLIDVPNLTDAEKPDYVLHIIAHEIGHAMIGRGHPDDNEPGEAVVLKWDGNGGRDPHVRSRLMCSGDTAGTKSRGKCLIKKEWDKIETWLRNEEINQRL